MRRQLATISETHARRAGQAVAALLAASEPYRRSSRLLVYAAQLPELPLDALVGRALADGKTLLWPRVCGEDLEFVPSSELDRFVPGAFGLAEPPALLPPTSLAADDLLLLPGLAFDARGARLGRGRSFFDRALEQGPGSTAFRCGVGYAFQWVPEVPEEGWDLRVDAFVSPLGFLALGDTP